MAHWQNISEIHALFIPMNYKLRALDYVLIYAATIWLCIIISATTMATFSDHVDGYGLHPFTHFEINSPTHFPQVQISKLLSNLPQTIFPPWNKSPFDPMSIFPPFSPHKLLLRWSNWTGGNFGMGEIDFYRRKWAPFRKSVMLEWSRLILFHRPKKKHWKRPGEDS